MLDIRSCQRGVVNKTIPIYYWCLISVSSVGKKKKNNSKHILELRKFKILPHLKGKNKLTANLYQGKEQV